MGTVQWGLSYGVSNRNGKTSISEVGKILRYAEESGVNILDTAYAYGNAEQVIGEHKKYSHNFKVVTKIRPHKLKSITNKDVSLIVDGFYESMKHMRCTRVYGLLVHNEDSLLSPGSNKLWNALQLFRSKGQIEKIGVSVYHPEQLEKITDRFSIDLVQVPLNIYDQRFSITGLLQKIKQKGIEVHVRSAFLQGLLLMPPGQLSDHFNVMRKQHAQLHSMFDNIGITPLEGCLQFCLNQENVDRVVVGCENVRQLQEIVQASTKKFGLELADLACFHVDNDNIINPNLWPIRQG